MDSLQCPGCGAAVRPKESWCSLCYRELRPAPPQDAATPEVSVEAASAAEPSLIRTNLIEADLGLRAVIPRPTVAGDNQTAGDNQPAGDDAATEDDASEAGERPKSWPCTCGEHVSIDEGTCPTCGRAFLDELRGLEGPGRTGPRWLSSYLEASRAVRLGIAAGIAAVIAFGIPGILALFG